MYDVCDGTIEDVDDDATDDDEELAGHPKLEPMKLVAVGCCCACDGCCCCCCCVVVADRAVDALMELL